MGIHTSEIRTLVSLYDRGLLVPFIGAGMSIPKCVTWPRLIENLESQLGDHRHDAAKTSNALTIRAHVVIERMRREGLSVADSIRRAVYDDSDSASDFRCTAGSSLANLAWPLVCSTNYDDLYLRAVEGHGREPPRVLGRSESDCRRVLHHLSLPVGEILWAMQGYLPSTPSSSEHGHFDSGRRLSLSEEVVLGHAEYRKATHRTPHFRRCFAEVFRTRSLFFVGSGLEEAYFRGLFDEVIELAGPPVRPHFAIVQEGTVDPIFMRDQYHIHCYCYPKAEHHLVKDYLSDFSDFVHSRRVRPATWTYRFDSPRNPERVVGDSFLEVCRGLVPKTCAGKEVIGVSVGRGKHCSPRGKPLPGKNAKECIGQTSLEQFEWLSDYTVRWQGHDKLYGVAARSLVDDTETSQERRHVRYIGAALKDFLCIAHANGARIAHVRLLAAGAYRVFDPWVSLVAMARAFGQWQREVLIPQGKPGMGLVIYTRDSGVTTLLNGNYIDLVDQLEDSKLRLRLEVIDTTGRSTVSQLLVDSTTPLKDLDVFRLVKNRPMLSAIPAPAVKAVPSPLDEVTDLTVGEFGLVPGSTLLIDYRAT